MMEFDERVKAELISIGFQEKEGQPIMTASHAGTTYGVDFEKQVVFYMEGMERVTREDDPKDAYLLRLQEIIEKSMRLSKKGVESEDAPDHHEDNTSAKKNAPEDEGTETYEPEADKTSGTPLLDLISEYTGNDVIEVFGETGSGKSKFSLAVAQEAVKAGKSVFYLDTERNLTTKDIDSLKGCQYKYTPVLEEIDNLTRSLPKADVVIIDSIGFPVLTSFARMSVKQKGDSLLKLIAIFGDLKEWAYRNEGIAIVTNQPESEFNKGPGHTLRPFGDKSQFAAKEIWKTEIAGRTPDATKITISAFRSRSVGHKTNIAKMKITSQGVEVV